MFVEMLQEAHHRCFCTELFGGQHVLKTPLANYLNIEIAALRNLELKMTQTIGSMIVLRIIAISKLYT